MGPFETKGELQAIHYEIKAEMTLEKSDTAQMNLSEKVEFINYRLAIVLKYVSVLSLAPNPEPRIMIYQTQ